MDAVCMYKFIGNHFSIGLVHRLHMYNIHYPVILFTYHVAKLYFLFKMFWTFRKCVLLLVIKNLGILSQAWIQKNFPGGGGVPPFK